MFSFFDVIFFWFNGKIEQNILGTTSSEQSENNRLPWIIAPFWREKKKSPPAIIRGNTVFTYEVGGTIRPSDIVINVLSTRIFWLASYYYN